MNTAYQIAITLGGLTGISAIVTVFLIALTDQFKVSETAIGVVISLGFIAAITGIVSGIIGVWM